MLTVLISTHNGEHVLGKVLTAYTKLIEPKGGWKLVVVNNACSDNTASVLESFKDSLPLTILSETQRGKNIALNSALKFIEGDIVVLTDDDAIPSPNWLVRWRETADSNPDVFIFGGRIKPYWETPPPNWVLKVVPLGIAFCITPDELEAGDVNPGMIWGANMMVRTDIFVLGVRFNEQVGPTAGNYLMGSETEFNHRVVNMGYRCCYFPEIEVQHIIRPYQFTEKWLLDRAYRHGKMKGHISKLQRYNNIALLAGYPRWLLVNFCEQVFVLGWARLKRDMSTAFEAKWRLKEILGFFSEFK